MRLPPNRLRLEQLEDRRMLAVFTVTNLLDGPVQAPGDLPGSLRQAIYDANELAGADEIVWTPGLTGTFTLTEGQLSITDDVSVMGLGRDDTVIDAAGQSRVLSSVADNVSLNNLQITGGRTLDGGPGGGVFNRGNLTLSGVVLTHNETSEDGDGGDGGGLYSTDGTLTIVESVVTGNTAASGAGGYYAGNGGSGGGIYVVGGDLTIINTKVTGNLAGSGGYYFGYYYTSAGGDGGAGGGIAIHEGDAFIQGSVISDNRAGDSGLGYYGGWAGRGGGLYASKANVTITQSTLSGNEAGTQGLNIFVYGDGGGAFVQGNLTVRGSTVTDNRAGDGGSGGGLAREGPGDLTIAQSIVAGNTGIAPDLNSYGVGVRSVRFSLVGNNRGAGLLEAPIGQPDANGNLVGGPIHGMIDPFVGPLTDNGGLLPTHALLPGSPAIDAGDPLARAGVGDVPLYDQRGMPFGRVSDGDATPGARIDIGAFEFPPVRPACDLNLDEACDTQDLDVLTLALALGIYDPLYDFTGDGLVDLADRDFWLAEAGVENLPSGNAYLLGDANLDGAVDGQDFIIWNQSKFTATAAWSQGDFNADGQTDGQDFVIWNQFKFQKSDEEEDTGASHSPTIRQPWEVGR